MHKSRLAGYIIDCKTADLDAAAEFWSKALGYDRVRSDDDGLYVGLQSPDADPYIEVQRVDHDSRIHLDIESDNKEAEARRLESLGAKRVGEVKTWIVMEAPTGQRFCIVDKQHKDFDATANSWE